MIDLHTHVLCGIDDGPADLVGSLAMAEIAVEEGVETLVATPHVRADHPLVVPSEVPGRAAELQAAFTRYDLPVEVVPGGEVALGEALELPDDDLRAVTLGANGTMLLVETPHGRLPSLFEELVDAVADRGYVVVLAHPELNPQLQDDPERLRTLVARGALVQLTARSLREPRRSRARALAARALEEGWAHAIASDAHAAEWRSPRLASQLEDARRAHPALADVLWWAATEAPAAILHGDRPGAPPPRAAGARRRLRRR
ncbi:MAG TPA: CpsB/CapC family capsule biosynthesis tyrosine phosphatase [Solirubrobacteraceae bacterium]|nr:CpsB/CapC family capsule biosynthesis tyrosine phosphatase [Solirubrobacteraceae bacterium]